MTPNANVYRCVGGPVHGKEFALQPGHFRLEVADCLRVTSWLTPDPDLSLPAAQPVHLYEVRRIFFAGYAIGKFLVHESLWNRGDGRDYMGIGR
jgi:hypothetical protein